MLQGTSSKVADMGGMGMRERVSWREGALGARILYFSVLIFLKEKLLQQKLMYGAICERRI